MEAHKYYPAIEALWNTYRRTSTSNWKRKEKIKNKIKMVEKLIIDDILMNEIDVLYLTCLGSQHQWIIESQVNVTHVIIDEATLNTLPMSLMPINLLANDNNTHNNSNNSKHLTLIGDPKQLFPIVQSSKAIEKGLNQSLFEFKYRVIG